MVVLEAMACGKPIICFDFGGPGEFVTKECGIKVKPYKLDQSVKDIANALLKLATDAELHKRLSEGARHKIEQNYAWEIKAKRLDYIYTKVLSM